MKKIILAVSALVLGTAAAHAADGTITITGKVTDKTCTINANAAKDFTVALPTVSTSSLPAVGATAGRTPFTIKLTQCSVGNVATYFEPGSTVDFGSGNLLNAVATGNATNVQVQLLGDNNLPIKIQSSGGTTQTNSQTVNVAQANGSADLNYYAQYYATGAASTGNVSTSVKYTIIYP